MNPAGVPNRAAPKLRSGLDGSLTEIGAGLSVGREPECGLCIPTSVVSRLHARIGWRDGGLWIEDPGSTNGTYVNGQRIAAATELHEGDQIAFDTLIYQLIDLLPPPLDQERTALGMRALQPAELAAAVVAGSAVVAVDSATAPAPAPAPAPDPAPTSAPIPVSAPAVAHTPPLAPPAPTAVPATAPVRLPAAPSPPPRPTPAPAAIAPPPPTAAPQPLPKPTPPPPSRDPAMAAGIPASWAESGQLENASHTMMMPAQLLNALSQSTVSTRAVIAAVRAESGRVQPALIGLTTGVAGQVYPLDPARQPGQWEIGRNRESDISINDHSVSGRHAQILRENGRWKLVNLMSINGSFVNERKVLSAHLNTGDKIRLGNVELAFDAGGELPRGRARGADSSVSLGTRMGALWRWLRARLRR